MCYGRNLASGRLVELGEATGSSRRSLSANRELSSPYLPHRWYGIASL
jgi:hypothetical protein